MGLRAFQPSTKGSFQDTHVTIKTKSNTHTEYIDAASGLAIPVARDGLYPRVGLAWLYRFYLRGSEDWLSVLHCSTTAVSSVHMS